MIMKNCEHENVLGIDDVVYVPRKGRIIGDIYIVTALMETDLSKVMNSN